MEDGVCVFEEALEFTTTLREGKRKHIAFHVLEAVGGQEGGIKLQAVLELGLDLSRVYFEKLAGRRSSVGAGGHPTYHHQGQFFEQQACPTMPVPADESFAGPCGGPAEEVVVLSVPTAPLELAVKVTVGDRDDDAICSSIAGSSQQDVAGAGSEHGRDTPMSPPDTSQELTVRTVTELYEKHGVECAPDEIGALVGSYEGHEAELIEKLQAKYEPEALADDRRLLYTSSSLSKASSSTASPPSHASQMATVERQSHPRRMSVPSTRSVTSADSGYAGRARTAMDPTDGTAVPAGGHPPAQHTAPNNANAPQAAGTSARMESDMPYCLSQTMESHIPISPLSPDGPLGLLQRWETGGSEKSPAQQPQPQPQPQPQHQLLLQHIEAVTLPDPLTSAAGGAGGEPSAPAAEAREGGDAAIGGDRTKGAVRTSAAPTALPSGWLTGTDTAVPDALQSEPADAAPASDHSQVSPGADAESAGDDPASRQHTAFTAGTIVPASALVAVSASASASAPPASSHRSSIASSTVHTPTLHNTEGDFFYNRATPGAGGAGALGVVPPAERREAEPVRVATPSFVMLAGTPNYRRKAVALYAQDAVARRWVDDAPALLPVESDRNDPEKLSLSARRPSWRSFKAAAEQRPCSPSPPRQSPLRSTSPYHTFDGRAPLFPHRAQYSGGREQASAGPQGPQSRQAGGLFFVKRSRWRS